MTAKRQIIILIKVVNILLSVYDTAYFLQNRIKTLKIKLKN